MGSKFFNNTTDVVRDDLKTIITPDSKVSVAAACFSIYAFQALKDELEKCSEFRFIFTSPTFVAEKMPKERREFFIPRLTREKSLYGTEFEVRLRNKLKQKAIAKECADWIRRKARFLTNTTDESVNQFLVVDNPENIYTYTPFNEFTTVGLGCERGNTMTNFTTRIDNPDSKNLLNTFEAIWQDKAKLVDVTDEIIDKHPGIMHACGHDIHMSVALGILSYFSENQPKDNLVFFFQPAEESESGGMKAYNLGLFTGDFQVDEFYGLHDKPDLPAGAIGCREGTLFAGTCEVNINIEGKGGHAAFPQRAKDSVVALASLILQIQTIISRSIDPIESGVITFGKLEAGHIRNVIADHARIEGTIRGLTQAMIEKIIDRIKEICQGVALSYGVKVTPEFNQGGYWPVENNPDLTKNFISYMRDAKDVDYIETSPAMTGEDFGFLLNKIPGTMFWLGVDDDSSLHSATFTPKEAAIYKGVQAITGFLAYRMMQG